MDRRSSQEEGASDDLKLDLGRLDITNAAVEVDLSDLNDDLVKFLQEDSVRDDLLKGVDLQQYARDIDAQLRAAEEDAVFDCMLRV
jgi:hypothetical protein